MPSITINLNIGAGDKPKSIFHKSTRQSLIDFFDQVSLRVIIVIIMIATMTLTIAIIPSAINSIIQLFSIIRTNPRFLIGLSQFLTTLPLLMFLMEAS